MEIVKAVATTLGLLSLVFILAVLCAYPTMWLVNYLFTPTLLTAIFGIPQLTVLKALWLNVFIGFVLNRGSDSSKK